MDALPLPLCSYCSSRPARPTDPYCCDGCRVLAELTANHEANMGTPPTGAQDTALTENFGRDLGRAVRFECHVDPLACEACLQGLARLETLVPSIRNLQWRRNESVLSFEFSKAHAQPAYVFEFLRHLGLSPRWKTENESPRRTQRTRTLRLALTGALAANLMLFSVPIYAGLEGSLRTIFEVVQLILFLPVLFWCAQPVYRTAWMSLRLRQLSVDLPLTIAFLAGSSLSIASVLRGGHDIYFDSLAGFLFLILWSRSLLENSLARFLETPGLERFIERPLFEILRDGRPVTMPWNDLRPGDEVTLRSGDRVPVDGVLLSISAEFESAWMTGEKTPHWRLKGAPVQAGSRLVSTEAVLRVTRPAAETEFARLLGQLKNSGEQLRPSFEARLGNGLVLGCFMAIALLFVFGGSLGLDEILRRGFALLIVACPCAVSFAAPLARAKANRLAFQRGFWIRDALVWTRLTNVRKIAFDKTGTLTGGAFALARHSPMIDPYWKQIILALENVSHHPIAESLRRAWGPMRLPEISQAREIPGVGVEGVIGGVSFQLRGGADENGRLRVELWRAGARVVELHLQDDVPLGTREALDGLHRSYSLSLVSGDRLDRVIDFGRRYGFAKDRLFGELSPERKVQVLEKIAPDIYFGDGTNDLPALAHAPVSVAVSGASLEAQAAADILMFDAGLQRVPELMLIAKETRFLNLRNFGLALTYNLAAGAAALAGLVSPLGAAVLMPAASLILLLSTLRGTPALRRLGKTA